MHDHIIVLCVDLSTVKTRYSIRYHKNTKTLGFIVLYMEKVTKFYCVKILNDLPDFETFTYAKEVNLRVLDTELNFTYLFPTEP